MAVVDPRCCFDEQKFSLATYMHILSLLKKERKGKKKNTNSLENTKHKGVCGNEANVCVGGALMCKNV